MQFSFFILDIFCLFTSLTARKIKFFYKMEKKKKKKTQLEAGDTIILHKYNKIHDHMLYCSWDMAHDGCNCYFSFWAIFCPFTPLTAQKTKIFKKKWQKPLEISFYTCAPKYMIRWCRVLEIWCSTDGQTDRWMDRWKKWNIEVGARPKKVKFKGSSFPKLLLDHFCSKICC